MTSANDVAQTAKDLLREIRDDDVTGLAAELAYRFLLALFPFVIFLGALGAFVADLIGIDNPTQQIMDQVAANLPSEAATILSDQLDAILQSKSPGLLSVGIVAALWAAGGGMNAIIKSLNRAYDVREARPWWRRTAIALGLTAFAGTSLIAAFVLLVVGQYLGNEVAGVLGLSSEFGVLIIWARIPLVVALLLFGTAFMYSTAPNANLPFRFISPGAVLFTVGWLLASWAFGFYVSNFGSYNATYGALGGVIILLLWAYLSAVVLLVGAELNAILHARFNESAESVAAGPADDPQHALPPGPEGSTAAARDGWNELPEERPSDRGAERARTRSDATPPLSGRVAAALGVMIVGVVFWRALKT